MRRPGIPRFLALASKSDTKAGLLDSIESPVPPDVLVVVAPGNQVVIANGRVRLLSSDTEMGLAEALEAGRASVKRGFSWQVLFALFGAAVHNDVWARLVFRLAARGQNLDEWRLETDESGLRLTHHGGVRAEVGDPFWWRIQDPDRADAIAQQLIEQLGIDSQWGISI